MIESVDPKGNIITYTYDSFNRAIRVVDSLGNTTESVYNKNDKVTSTTLTSAEGKIITTGYIYDADNRVISETNTL
jgi:YD repeat-containing protein